MLVMTGKTEALLQGEILLETHAYSAWGGAVTAHMYLPLTPQQVWQHVTDYSCWTQYFPDVTHSEIISPSSLQKGAKRLYQVASKAFMFFTAQVEIYLKVLETQYQRIQFQLESGSFHEFQADLQLSNHGNGTLLSYSVKAIPTIPVPSLFIEQAIRFDLPMNMRKMRQVICQLAK